MIIPIRGPWKEITLDGQASQIHTIGVKMNTYKITLGIPQTVIDRVEKADAMYHFVREIESNVDGFKTGLTAYKHQLLEGNPLQMMNAFQGITPFGIAPAADRAGIWDFITSERNIFMEHDNWTDAIGEDMHLLGALINFDTDLYFPKLKVKIFPGYIEVKTDSAIIGVHRLFVGTSGTNPLPAIVDFKGATHKYYRTLTPPTTSEKLDIVVQGLVGNVLVGHVSQTETEAYKG